MASVTFSTAAGGDGSTVTDDANTSTGLANGGHRTRFVPALAQTVAVAARAVEAGLSAVNSPSSYATSATSNTVGSGSKIFILDQYDRAYMVGLYVYIVNPANPSNWMAGPITAFTGWSGTMTVNVLAFSGGGTFSSWAVAPTSPAIASGTFMSSETRSADATLTSNSARYQFVNMTLRGQSLTLPDATTMLTGGPLFIFDNSTGTRPFGVRDSTGRLVAAVGAGGVAYVALQSNATAAGKWSFTGENLQPGLITMDYTFNNTFYGYWGSVLLRHFVALDSDKSIHFIRGDSASGFLYAFVIDYATKSIGTPVLITSAAASPSAAFRVSATTAIVFYGGSIVVLSLSGATTLSVGTAVTPGAPASWPNEPPRRIAQLNDTTFVVSYVSTGSAVGVLVVTVSGTTVTAGTPATTSASVQSLSPQIYALNSTTALVFWVVFASPNYDTWAAVVSVSGTTATFGTAQQVGRATSSYASPITGLISSSKAIVADGNGGVTQMNARILTISGTNITPEARLLVETDSFSGNNYDYSNNSATIEAPHLVPLPDNRILFHYLDTSNISRAVLLQESSGSLSAGSIVWRSISNQSTSNFPGVGRVVGQTNNSFLALKAMKAETAGSSPVLVPHKLLPASGNQITIGAAKLVPELGQVFTTNAYMPAVTPLGKYVFATFNTGGTDQANLAGPGIVVADTDGDVVRYGVIDAPRLVYNGNQPFVMDGGKRVVVMGSPFDGSLLGDTTTGNMRALVVEIAA